MTNEELQTVVAAVIQALKTNGKTIDQLTPVTSLADSDCLEVGGGKKIAFSKLKELVASAVVVTEESIKSWVVIESTDDLPEEPTPAEQEKAYVLAEGSTLYVYVGEGGDTLDGSYKSVTMKGADGAPGEPGPKGDSGVDLGEVVLVNDLTTGGEGNALSAEMGKTLNERLEPVESTLDINSSSEVVTERIAYVQNIGYINVNSISQQAGGQLRYSEPIFLKAGDSLKIKGITPSNVGRIATCDAQGGNVVRLEMGQSPQNPTSAADAYETTYTASDDVYVIVGWYWKFYQLELTKTYNKTTTTSKIDDVDAIVDVLDLEPTTETKTEDLVYTEKVGGYSGSAVGELSAFNAGYTTLRATDDFLLKQGDTLQITAKNVGTNVSLLVTLDGTLYRTVILGNGSTQSETYTAPVDGYYAVTWFAAQGVTLKVTTTITTTDSERIATIEENTTQIPAIAAKANASNDAIFVNIVDNFTSDVNEGQCISDKGLIANTGYGFKEFSVKAGAVVSFSSSTHSKIAPIAKKIAEGKYEPLFVATGFVYETFTYTATENCVLALSCYGASTTPLATINNQLVASNSLNIEKLFAAQQKSLIPDYGMFFDKVAVIGDSLSVGTLDGVSGDDAHAAGGSYGCSWLTYLAKKWCSSTRMHYGRGGTTAYSWLGDNGYGLGLMLKDSVVYDVYFIAYGHNDHGSFTIGTTSDTPTDVTVDANNDVTMETAAADTTFLGNYKKIVNEVRAKAPNALIFLVSTDVKDDTVAASIGYMNQFIEELAEWYYEQGDHKVFYIDYISKYVAKDGYRNGGHWSTFGYANIGRLINDTVNEVIETNLNTNALKAWGNYLESYRTTKNDQTRSGGYLPHL